MPRIATPEGYTPQQFGSELQDSLTTIGMGAPFGSQGAGNVWTDLKRIGAQTAKKAYLLGTWNPGASAPSGTGALAGGLAGAALAPTDEMFRKYAQAQNQDPELTPWTKYNSFDRVATQISDWGPPPSEEY